MPVFHGKEPSANLGCSPLSIPGTDSLTLRHTNFDRDTSLQQNKGVLTLSLFQDFLRKIKILNTALEELMVSMQKVIFLAQKSIPLCEL